MTPSATINTPIFEDPCTEEIDEELGAADLTDEEILMAFFRDGCDLDGTPLLMPQDDRIFVSNAETARTLH